MIYFSMIPFLFRDMANLNTIIWKKKCDFTFAMSTNIFVEMLYGRIARQI